jgi:hypothetical protein
MSGTGPGNSGAYGYLGPRTLLGHLKEREKKEREEREAREQAEVNASQAKLKKNAAAATAFWKRPLLPNTVEGQQRLNDLRRIQKDKEKIKLLQRVRWGLGTKSEIEFAKTQGVIPIDYNPEPELPVELVLKTKSSAARAAAAAAGSAGPNMAVIQQINDSFEKSEREIEACNLSIYQAFNQLKEFQTNEQFSYSESTKQLIAFANDNLNEAKNRLYYTQRSIDIAKIKIKNYQTNYQTFVLEAFQINLSNIDKSYKLAQAALNNAIKNIEAIKRNKQENNSRKAELNKTQAARARARANSVRRSVFFPNTSTSSTFPIRPSAGGSAGEAPLAPAVVPPIPSSNPPILTQDQMINDIPFPDITIPLLGEITYQTLTDALKKDEYNQIIPESTKLEDKWRNINSLEAITILSTFRNKYHGYLTDINTLLDVLFQIIDESCKYIILTNPSPLNDMIYGDLTKILHIINTLQSDQGPIDISNFDSPRKIQISKTDLIHMCIVFVKRHPFNFQVEWVKTLLHEAPGENIISTKFSNILLRLPIGIGIVLGTVTRDGMVESSQQKEDRIANDIIECTQLFATDADIDPTFDVSAASFKQYLIAKLTEKRGGRSIEEYMAKIELYSGNDPNRGYLKFAKTGAYGDRAEAYANAFNSSTAASAARASAGVSLAAAGGGAGSGNVGSGSAGFLLRAAPENFSLNPEIKGGFFGDLPRKIYKFNTDSSIEPIHGSLEWIGWKRWSKTLPEGQSNSYKNYILEDNYEIWKQVLGSQLKAYGYIENLSWETYANFFNNWQKYKNNKSVFKKTVSDLVNDFVTSNFKSTKGGRRSKSRKNKNKNKKHSKSRQTRNRR